MKIIKQSLPYLIVIVFLLKSIETLIPFKHADALYYHLLGAKLWWQSSWAEMWRELPPFVQAGLFDFFYIVPFFFFSSLLHIQQAGQFMHFFCSLAVAAFLFIKILQHRWWGPLAALACLTLSRDADFFLYAKNDGPLATLALLASYHLFQMQQRQKECSPRNLFILAVLLGLIPAIKMSGLLVVLPLGVASLWIMQQNGVSALKMALVTLLSLLIFSPQLIKNYMITGNPLFPALLDYFPGNLTPAMWDYYTSFFGQMADPPMLWIHLKDLFLGKLLFLTIPFLFVGNLVLGKKTPQLRALNFFVYLALATFFLYVSTNGEQQAPRFFFSCYMFFLLFIFLTLKQLRLHHKRPYFPLLILLLILADSKIDKSFSRAKNILVDEAQLTEKELLEKYIPYNRLWNRLTPPQMALPQERIYILSDDYSSAFYLPPHYRLHQVKQFPQAEFLYRCSDHQDLRELKKFAYALLKYAIENPCYRQIHAQGALLAEVEGYQLFKLQ